MSNIASRSEIPGALRLYEKSRKQRAETVQQSGSENRITLHLPDGPEQIARDEQFRASARGPSPDKWTDRATQRILWGWDAEEAALEVWNGTFLRSALTCQMLMCGGVARGYNDDKDRRQSVTDLPMLLYQYLLHGYKCSVVPAIATFFYFIIQSSNRETIQYNVHRVVDMKLDPAFLPHGSQ